MLAARNLGIASMAVETSSGNAGDSSARTDNEWLEAIDALLDEDAKDLELSFGRVWTGLREGKTDEQIGEEIGFAYTDNVSSYRIAISLIRGDQDVAVVELSRSRAKRCATYIRSFRKRHMDEGMLEEGSALARRLEMLIDECKGQADKKDVDEEDKEEKDARQNAEGQPGIYVYTLPHYRKHPFAQGNSEEEASTRTLYKVGKTEVDVAGRVKAQSSTGLPEPPQLLRRYFPNGDNALGRIKNVEKQLHRLLRAADHRPNREKGAGKEWFLTSLIFLDALAEVLDLQKYEMD